MRSKLGPPLQELSPADSSPKRIRLFIAVDFDTEVLRAVDGISGELKRFLEGQEAARRIRRKWSWVPVSNFHLTLKFLGSIEEERVPEILNALREASRSIEPFELWIEKVGAFPHVIWMGVSDRSLVLSGLVRELDEKLSRLGFDREQREFVPHLTLARLKAGKSIDVARDIDPSFAQKSAGKSLIREIVLYQSKTLPTGSVYNPLGRIPLLAR